MRQVHERAKKESKVHVIQLGAITVGQAGEELADIVGMAKAGCHAISEDGKSVMNASLYRKAMKIAKEQGIAIFAHCEDITMVEGGVMHADKKAETLGLKGITNAVEDVIVARDILLAKETGVRLHLCHCSTEDSVKLVRAAKKRGLAGHSRGVSASFYNDDRGYYRRSWELQDESAASRKKRCGSAESRTEGRYYGRDCYRSCTALRGGKK